MMTKADWLALAGYMLLASGAGMIYRPLAFVVAGLVCLRLAGVLVMNAQQPEERE